MHLALRVLFFWSIMGSVIPCAIIAAPLFMSGKYAVRTKVVVAVTCWPQLAGVMLFAWLLSLFMALRQKLNPQTQVPPAPPGSGNAR